METDVFMVTVTSIEKKQNSQLFPPSHISKYNQLWLPAILVDSTEIDTVSHIFNSCYLIRFSDPFDSNHFHDIQPNSVTNCENSKCS